ncbi:MAG: GNAT family N-acetyltransferase [Acidobacteriales bacterium]|nr:GNAT family N-acetyltransferase [Terriglobales bacterium]
MTTLLQAESPQQISEARALFEEYGASLGFSLCFQSFDKELAGLPGDYAPPAGSLVIAYVDDAPAGCVALHGFEGTTCEMKRLYVRPAFRGHRLGRQLIDRVIADARQAGYTHMRLDTVPGIMGKAVELYRVYGFREIAPYRVNPIEGALYMELDLSIAATKGIAP